MSEITDRTRNEIDAESQGAANQQKASDSLLDEYRSQAANAVAVGHEENQWNLGNRAQQGQDTRDAETARSNRTREQQTADQQDIEAAAHGVQRNGQSRYDASQAQAQQDPATQARIQKTKDDMARGSAQMNKPIESTGNGNVVPGSVGPTEEATQQKHAQLATERMRAMTEQQNAQTAFLRAQNEGNKQGMKDAFDRQEKFVAGNAQLFDRGMVSRDPSKIDSSKGLRDTDWKALEAIAAPNDQVAQQEIQSKQFGPRLQQLLDNQIAYDGLKITANTGLMPNAKYVNFSGETMTVFKNTADKMAQMFSGADAVSSGMFSKAMGINSIQDRNRILNKLSAQAVLQASLNPIPATPYNGPIPSQGGASMQGQPGGQQQQPGGAPAAPNPQRGLNAAAKQSGREPVYGRNDPRLRE